MRHANTVVVMQLSQNPPICSSTHKKPNGLVGSMKGYVEESELGTRSFFRGSLSAPHSIFYPGSLTLMRSFFEFPFSLVAQTLVAQPVVR
jgi:hypothetical protein